MMKKSFIRKGYSMIEVDDAGGGCFVGPEVLVIHDLESGKALFRYVDPTVIERVKEATRLLKQSFRDLKITKATPVRLCRGEIFDLFQKYLEEHGYNVVREKVSDATDHLAEARFMDILYSYGLPREIRLEGRNYPQFYQLIGCWFYCLNRREQGRICKARLEPPYWPRKLARRFPNLLRMMIYGNGENPESRIQEPEEVNSGLQVQSSKSIMLEADCS
jgi:hypothetical protein